MIFKNRFTTARVSLLVFMLYNNRVVILDSDNNQIEMTVNEFRRNYEYVWMPSK